MVAAGVTSIPPFAATDPIPGEIDTELAFDVFHVSVALLPAFMLAGDAIRLAVIITGFGPGSPSGADPAHPITRASRKDKTQEDK